MVQRICAVGASVRALAQELVRDGYEVVAADLFSDHDLRQIAQVQRIVNYPHDLLRLSDSVQADAWIYTGGLENYPELVDQLATRLPLLGNRGDVLRRVRNIELLRLALEQNGFHMPEMSSERPQELHQWLRKSQRSSGGLRVAWATADASPLQAGEYYQRFVAGTAYGANFITDESDTVFLGATQHLIGVTWTNAPPFQYAGSLGPISFPQEQQRAIERLGSCVAREFNLRGWFGIDFVIDSDGALWALEVNPRYTASLEVLARCLGQNFAQEHITACLGQKMGGRGSRRALQDPYPFAGKAILYAAESITVTPQHLAMLHAQCNQPDSWLADVPAETGNIPAGTPVVSLLANAATAEQVLSELQQRAATLKTWLSGSHC